MSNPPSAPQAVVFDLGKVLVDFDYSIAARRIASRGRLSWPEIQRLIDQSPLLVRFETGSLNSEAFFREVCEATGYGGSFDEFRGEFADIFAPIPSMVKLHAALRERRIPTFLFSNTNEIAVAHIRHRFPFYSEFDGYVLSFEHGVMKPHAPIYEIVERMAGARGNDLLYLDDRQENIEAGSARGWQVILQETPEKTIAALRRLGLVP